MKPTNLVHMALPSPKTQQRYRENMNAVFTAMVNRVINAVHTEFTYEEVLDLTCPPDIAEAFKKVTAHMVTPVSVSLIPLPTPLGPVTFQLRSAGIAPKNPQLQTEVNLELREKFEEWQKVRVQIGIDYGRVWAVVAAVMDVSPLPAVQRQLFPQIRTIWLSDARTRRLADQHAKHRPNLKVPLLDYNVRTSMERAGKTLNRFNLLGQPGEMTAAVHTTMMPVPDRFIDEDGLEFHIY